MVIIFKNVNYQAMKTMLLFIMVIFWSVCASVDPFSRLDSTISGSASLYNSVSQIAQGFTLPFVVTFQNPVNFTPQLVLTLSGLTMKGSFTNFNFAVTKGPISSTTFTSYLINQGSSLIYMAQVMYIALDDRNNAFYCIPSVLSSFSKINSGTGTRSQRIVSNFYTLSGGNILNNNISLNRAYVSLSGFQIKSSSSSFDLQISIQLTNQITFLTTILVKDNCQVVKIDTFNMFIDTGSINNPGLFTFMEGVYLDNGNNYSYVATYIASPGHYVYGITQWKPNNNGITINSIGFKFQVNSSLVTNVNLANTEILQFSYFFLALKQCPSSFPYYADSTKTLCSDQCSVVMTQNPSSKICSPCISPCFQCKTISTLCISCITNYTIQGETCIKTVAISTTDERLYLLGLLSVIPVTLLIGYLCFRAPPERKFSRSQFVAQPSMDI